MRVTVGGLTVATVGGLTVATVGGLTVATVGGLTVATVHFLQKEPPPIFKPANSPEQNE